MPAGTMIVAGFVVAGIIATALVWRELDRVGRIVDEAERRRLGLSRPIREGPVKLGGARPRPRTPKPPYRPPSQKGRPEEGKQCNTRTFRIVRGGGDEMTNIRQAIDDLIDAADILVSRRDHVTGDVALIPRTSISRLEVALEEARRAIDADKPVVYLASPYSHPDPAVRELRYEIAGEVATRLLHSGYLVYSPIVHSHPLVLHGLSTGWEYWRDLDMAMLSRCQELLVLTISGWAESEGVQAEILAAKEMGMPIRYTWHGSRGRD